MIRVFAALAGTLLAAAASSSAFAQANGPGPGSYGAEDGYNDDGFGWGPAYRPQTNFRPAYGFYGGVERPYPYARSPRPDATGSLGRPAASLVTRGQLRPGKAARRAVSRRRRGASAGSQVMRRRSARWHVVPPA